MRKTTINVSSELDRKIDELIKLTDGRNFTRIIEAAVYNYLRMVKSSGAYAPTYTLDNIYVECEDGEDGLDVFQDVEGGPFFYQLRKAKNLDELMKRPFFVEVTSDDLEFPRAIYDYEEVKPSQDNEFWNIVGLVGVTPENWQPKFFQRAGLVATPQLGLIGSY